MRKKILLVVTKSGWGGAQRYVYDIALSFAIDNDVVVACGGNGELTKKLQSQKIRVVTIPHLERDISIIKEIRSLVSLWKIFRAEKPDIVHLNSSKAGGLGALVARLAQVPNIIFTAHGWAFLEDRPLYVTGVIWFLSWLTAVFAHTIIIITRRDLAATRRFFCVPKHKFVLIPNGISENDIPFLDAATARSELGISLPWGALLTGTITEFTPNKGLPYLLSAMEALPSNIHLILIGGGEDEQIIKARSQSTLLKNRVHVTGFRQNAARYLKALDIFVFPSIKEGLPYALLEAGLAGLPVVATTVGGIPDIITHGLDGLLVTPKDPAGLGASILLLADEPDLRMRFAEHFQEKVRSAFSKEVMIRRIGELYGI